MSYESSICVSKRENIQQCIFRSLLRIRVFKNSLPHGTSEKKVKLSVKPSEKYKC